MNKISADLIACFSKRPWVAILLITSLVVATPAKSAVTYTGSGPGNDAGETNSATAVFDLSVSGTTTNLIVTLTNTSPYKPNDSPDILSAVFFSVAGDLTLTRISGVLNTGSVGLKNGSNLTVPGGVVGGSWSYAAGLSGTPGNANEGISSAGFTQFGPGDLFPGATLPGDNNPPDGVGGGLTTATDDGSLYNGGLSGKPLIKDSAVFTLGDVPASFTLADISTVSFQYGTTIGTEPNAPGNLVPEPSSVALTGCGLLLLGLLQRKRR